MPLEGQDRRGPVPHHFRGRLSCENVYGVLIFNLNIMLGIIIIDNNKLLAL